MICNLVTFFVALYICRCYNCGEFANHLASQCNKGPMPKRCHNCKSEEHLIEECPTLPSEKRRPKTAVADHSSEEAADDEGDGGIIDSKRSQPRSSKGKKQTTSTNRRDTNKGKKINSKNGN